MRYELENDYSEGGSAEFYYIKGRKDLGFKQFRNKRCADIAYKNQKKLSKYGLAPKVIGKVRKLKINIKDSLIENFKIDTNWGYVTEMAKIPSYTPELKPKFLKKIQVLVDQIQEKTKLKFWDCHYDNVGYVKRKNRIKLVCIDTGKESFCSLSNAWGNANPGPSCNQCNKYLCGCYM